MRCVYHQVDELLFVAALIFMNCVSDLQDVVAFEPWIFLAGKCAVKTCEYCHSDLSWAPVSVDVISEQMLSPENGNLRICIPEAGVSSSDEVLWMFDFKIVFEVIDCVFCFCSIRRVISL